MSRASKHLPPNKRKPRPVKKKKPPVRQAVAGEIPSFADARAAMEAMFRTMGRGGVVDDPRDHAFDLAMAAYSAGSPREAERMAEEAIALDPASVDARMILAELRSPDPPSRIAAVEQIVADARAGLGSEFIAASAGMFWGIVETRPFMRALGILADLCSQSGRYEEAIAHCEEMLRLNPNDNQGIRDPLLGLYLAVGRVDDAERLLAQFVLGSSEEMDDATPRTTKSPDVNLLTTERVAEWGAMFAWGWVLDRLLRGDTPVARKAYVAAHGGNPHVAAYLVGAKFLPGTEPDSYSIGSEEEAIITVDFLLFAWKKHPDAHAWLKAEYESRKH